MSSNKIHQSAPQKTPQKTAKALRVTIIAGARPNFIKVAPLIKAIERHNGAVEAFGPQSIQYRLVHTGQHYDKAMSQTFFEELNIPKPHINLGCGGGTQAEQTAAIMVAFEKEFMENPADLVIVVGDVTSTMACSIVAKKLNTKVSHIEAGIRSYDMTMPEEINRMVTDCLADLFFTTTLEAGENLIKAGVDKSKIHFVGNIMIDTLLANRKRFREPQIWREANLKEKEYIVLTLHRPGNVDDSRNLIQLLEAIVAAAGNLKVVFPIHPRTAAILAAGSPAAPLAASATSQGSPTAPHNSPTIISTPPLPYLEFNYLVEKAKVVITDSGGITEECTVMGVPCITLRDSTERPETCTIGTNELIGTNPTSIAPAMQILHNGEWKKGGIPQKWDGKTAERIVEQLINLN